MESKKRTRVSLFMIDRLMHNDLGDSERQELEKKIEQNQELKDYIQQHSDLHSNLQFSKLQERINNGNSISRFCQYLGQKIRLFFHPPVMSTVVVATLLLMLAGVSFIVQHNNQQHYLGVKGESAYEVQLLIKGKLYSKDQVIRVADNDTLSFLYRSPQKIYVMFLYSEDDGAVKSFMVTNDHLVWTPTIAESIAPVSILLEGTWKKQVVWVIASSKKMSFHKAEKIIKKPTGHSTKVYTFYLIK